MRLLYLSFVLALVASTALGASILDQNDWQSAQGISVSSCDQEIPYRCSFDPLPHARTHGVAQARSLPLMEYGTRSVLHQSVGFMPLLDVLSILGVGLFALAVSGVAAFLRRQDAIRTASLKGVSTPRLEHQCQPDYLHELPSSGDPAESELILKYIRTKLG